MTSMRRAEGTSLVELMISLAMGLIVLAGVVAAFLFSLKSWQEMNERGRLHLSVENAVEILKHDLRLSSGNYLIFDPQGGAEYTAISMPASTSNAQGFLTFSGGGIQWNSTVIYHVYSTGTEEQLRRTVLNSFNTSAATRQTALTALLTSGTAVSGEGATEILFSASDVSLRIIPQFPVFDGYASEVTRSPNSAFGSVTLTPGLHTIRFEVTGKNASSTGYQIGIDSVLGAPSGAGSIEAEALLPAVAASGATPAKEDMLSTGNQWSGNNQVVFPATATANYFSLQFYYDQWLESNFNYFTRNYLSVEGSDPYLTVQSREEQGAVPAWQVEAQTGSPMGANTLLNGYTIRNVISGSLINRPATMVRIQFKAPETSDLTIDSATFGLRSGQTANFSDAPVQLYFSNSTVEEGDSDGVGSTESSGPTSITIPANHHVWSNWFLCSWSVSAVPDYLVSYKVSDNSSQGYCPTWTDASSSTCSYYALGDFAGSVQDFSLQPFYAATSNSYAVPQVAAWTASGTATSRIVDTQASAPAYQQIDWISTLPSGSSASVKVRTSANSDMSGATDWASLASYSSGASLTALASERYLQYQIALQSGSPYATQPIVDNVKLTWQRPSVLTELSGYYTKGPGYGMFKVLVDNNPTVKALEVRVEATSQFNNQPVRSSARTEVKPMNTGK